MAGEHVALVVFLLGCTASPAAHVTSPPIQGSAAPIELAHPFSVGGMHACARTSDARVMCWGLNEFGQLGDGTREDRFAPVIVPGVGDVAGVAAGSQHTCIWTRRGDAVCWGGYGSTEPEHILPTPRPIFGLTNVIEIVAGAENDCARVRDGRVFCFNFWSWGAQLPPLEIPGAKGATRLVVGSFLSCGLLAGGKVGCWKGPLGPYDTDAAKLEYAKVMEVPQAEGVLGLAADRATLDNFLGWQSSGAYVSWRTEVGTPPETIPPPALPRFRALAMGHELGCGLDERGVSCWTHDDKVHGAPSLVAGTAGALQLDVGSSSPYHEQNTACASFADGTLSCWGRASQVGAGITDFTTRAVAVPGITDAVELAANNEGHYACVRHRAGRVSCWGSLNETFWSGGDPEVFWRTPRDAGVEGVSSLIAGSGGVCALRAGKPWTCIAQKRSTMSPTGTNHVVGAWDLCSIGVTGEVTCTPGVPPDEEKVEDDDEVTVPRDLGKVKRLWLGFYDGCAERRDGKLVCWYRNLVQGTDTYLKRWSVVVADDVIDAAIGASASCFVRKSGVVACVHQAVPFGAPENVEGITDATAITAGFGGFCALRRDGHVACWSETYRVDREPSRDGTFTKLVTIEGLDDAISVKGAELHVCALRKTGQVACWGRREFLGGGDTILTGPMKVTGLRL